VTVAAGSAAAQPLEGLEQPVGLGGRDDRPGVSDRHDGASVLCSGGDLDVPARDIVPHGVLDQVRYQPPDEQRVAVNAGGPDVSQDLEAEAAGLGGGGEAGAGQGRQVVGLALAGAAFAAGEGEQCLDEAFLLGVGGQQFGADALPVSRLRAGLARVTWSRLRSLVIGVRRSWDALATKRRWASNDASNLANRSSRVSPSSFSSSCGPGRARRSCRLLAEIRRAAAVIAAPTTPPRAPNYLSGAGRMTAPAGRVRIQIESRPVRWIAGAL
jgi:hypothetical protein